MKNEKNKPQSAGKKRIRYPGIVGDARKLGVNRVTLYKMLRGYHGFAGLKTLRHRYNALKAREVSR